MNCWVGHFAGVKALVVGDAMQDVYHFGRCDRLSPEAPVPVFVETCRVTRDGGAANVSAQLEALGATVDALYGSPVSNKHRYMVGSHYLFRHDEDRLSSSPAGIDFAQLVSGHRVIVLSDYAKGLLTFDFCQSIIQAAYAADIPVVVDPKGADWSKYRGATMICPNHLELEQAGATLASVMFSVIVEKRGAAGICIHQGEVRTNFPAINPAPVDVTGAGDTVTAIMALALATSMPIEMGARLANEAAAIVVGRVGTSVVHASELQ